jgi:exodeoxyribonuclease V alpha subunit
VVVDEASMVDVALLAKLVRAVPPTARLLLVGDKDQLASVEAGAILGDIYGRDGARGSGAAPRYSADVAAAVQAVTGEEPPIAETHEGIGDCRVHLTESRRYSQASGIARAAAAINAGDAEGALDALSSSPDAVLREPPRPGALERALGDAVLSVFGSFRGASPAERLARADAFRILCVHRRGPHGVETVNAWAERYLYQAGKKPAGSDLYDGRPILITENDPHLELYNGDVGILCSAQNGAIEACFMSEGGVRHISPARLPSHETVFAMTVHKSQGSEFDRVVLLLPAEPSPLLTRELLYTAITRARSRVEIYGTPAVLASGVRASLQRSSGLAEVLRGEPSTPLP